MLLLFVQNIVISSGTGKVLLSQLSYKSTLVCFSYHNFFSLIFEYTLKVSTLLLCFYKGTEMQEIHLK